MKKCAVCGMEQGRLISSNGVIFCGRCYQRRNIAKYPLPAVGEVAYSELGNPICHICGEAHRKLMSHVTQVHKLTSLEYKKKYGLDLYKGIMNEEATRIARNNAINNIAQNNRNLLEGEGVSSSV